MKDIRFDKPVEIRREAEVIWVCDTEQATQLLKTSWPAARGKWYYAASRACALASAGKTFPYVARSIFQKAVEESRLN